VSAVWTVGGIILTPELTTTSTVIPWLQLFFAACLLSRQTLIIAALGIVFLFGVAIENYGAFHLADYPIFLGIAAYIGAIGLGTTIFGFRPMDVLRWSTAITLMWASVEKWAYPPRIPACRWASIRPSTCAPPAWWSSRCPSP
jgi:hypothetical protein